MVNTFVENTWLGNRELIMYKQKDRYVVYESDINFRLVFTGDYGGCHEFMNQEFIAYQEDRIG